MSEHVCRFEQVVSTSSHWHCIPGDGARCGAWAVRKCEFCGNARCASHAPVEPPAGPVMAELPNRHPTACLTCGGRLQGNIFTCNACYYDPGHRRDEALKCWAAWKAGARDFPRKPVKVDDGAPEAWPAVTVPAEPSSPETFACRLGQACHHCSPPRPVPFVPTVDEWDLLPDAFNLRGGR